MKALDLLSLETIKVPPATLLIGDDHTLKALVTDRMAQASGKTKDDTERQEVKSADEAAEIIGQGSLFGPRLLILDFNGKWGRVNNLIRVLPEAKEAEDTVIIRAEQAPNNENFTKHCTEVECKPPTHPRTKEKLIRIRLNYYRLYASEEAVKRLADRIDSAADLEIALTTLSLVHRPNHHLTVPNIEQATAEPPARRDLTRALLIGNVTRIAKELREGEPIPTLALFHNTLTRLYVWIEMTKGLDPKKDKEKEDECAQTCKIPTRHRQDWRAAVKLYSSYLIRQTMNLVAEAYEQETSGRAGQWQEELQEHLRKFQS
jgi:DNA polymerase III delta subunit